MKVPITIKNQHELLNLVAGMYKTLDRVIMEYIDNSFDNAFENFYDEQNNNFSKQIKVVAEILRNKNQISVKDNCAGMNEAKAQGLAISINESDKKAKKRPWVNGQFGFGVHAFRGFADKLFVYTKQKGNTEYKIEIDRNEKDAEINKTQTYHIEENSSGTLVIVQDIEKSALRGTSIELLQKEVEKHFEPILNKNVTVIIKEGNNQTICKSFNYDEVKGFPIRKKVERWIEKSPRGTNKIIEVTNKPIMVNLIVSLEKIDRPPFFISRGRRINQISRMDSFVRKTTHKKKVWDHYYLTGYIDINGHLEPIITRDDFQGGKGYAQRRTAIYEELTKLEDEIYQAIEVVNADKVDKNLQNFASQLTDILTEIAKEDSYRLSQLSNLDEEGGRQMKKFTEEGEEDWLKKKEGDQPGNGGDGEQKETVKGKENEKGESEGDKVEKKKSNLFKIDFQKTNTPNLDRSAYSEGIITIFTSHPNFIDRIAQSNKAELDLIYITARLTSYLSAIISSHYKEAFYIQKKQQPDRNKALMEQVDFIVKFEEKLKDFIGKPLGELNKN